MPAKKQPDPAKTPNVPATTRKRRTRLPQAERTSQGEGDYPAIAERQIDAWYEPDKTAALSLHGREHGQTIWFDLYPTLKLQYIQRDGSFDTVAGLSAVAMPWQEAAYIALCCQHGAIDAVAYFLRNEYPAEAENTHRDIEAIVQFPRPDEPRCVSGKIHLAALLFSLHRKDWAFPYAPEEVRQVIAECEKREKTQTDALNLPTLNDNETRIYYMVKAFQIEGKPPAKWEDFRYDQRNPLAKGMGSNTISKTTKSLINKGLIQAMQGGGYRLSDNLSPKRVPK